MKKLLYFLISTLFILVSCNKDYTKTNKNYSTDNEADVMLSKYIRLNGTNIYLSIGKDDAEKLGVSPTFYDNAVSILKQSKIFLEQDYQDYLKNGNITELTISKDQVDSLLPCFKTPEDTRH